ncbi:MAG: inositol-3-phosphate synthase [Syntrophorhabdales bacterium]|jgi:myo-inositol-1-phosphate synthase
MHTIRIAVVGVGNCCSSLVQGINHYRKTGEEETTGLMHWDIGGYRPQDIEVVAAFDVDKRKVGRDVSEAIFEKPNCTTVFCNDIARTGATVKMGRVLDGCAQHMGEYPAQYTFLVSDEREPEKKDVVAVLRETGARILVNYLPVGSEQAARFYVECALEAGCALVNNIPVFIASDPRWVARFEEKSLPLIGDDIKSQLGATIIHRTLVDLFKKRGVKLERTYQINTGGNTDFLNMLNRDRLLSKKTSKTEAVQSMAAERLEEMNIHVGPSDYVPWQKDNKVCFIRLEGKLFGGIPLSIELRLSVEDSPNSAGIVIDAIRCCELALDRGMSGVLHAPAAFFMKHPPVQLTDAEAYALTEAFILGSYEEKLTGNPLRAHVPVSGAVEGYRGIH